MSHKLEPDETRAEPKTVAGQRTPAQPSFERQVTTSSHSLSDHAFPLAQRLSHEAYNELQEDQEDSKDTQYVAGTHEGLLQRIPPTPKIDAAAVSAVLPYRKLLHN